MRWLADGRITFGRDGDGRPMLKKYLSEVEDALTPSTWWEHDAFGSNKEASIELKELFGGDA
jgi:adenine-specific DNA-methyltransferase